MTRAPSISLALLALVAGLLAGCLEKESFPPGDGQPVARAVEVGMPCNARDRPPCPSFLACRTFDRTGFAGTCELAVCYRDQDCHELGDGLVCRDLSCVPQAWLSGEGRPCEDDADCPPYLECADGLYARVCGRPPCWLDWHCPAGLACREWRCVEPGCGL